MRSHKITIKGKNMRKYIALLGCLAALLGCGSSTPQPTVKAPDVVIKDPNAGYTVVNLGAWELQVPDSFEKKTSASGNVVYQSPDKMILVMPATFAFDGSLKDLLKKQALLNEETFNLKVIGVDLLLQDGATWYLLVSKNDTIFTGNLSLVENNQAYVITCAGYLANVKKSLRTCERVFQSVKRTKK